MSGATRIIVYTGKGGVGKTSVAAATALRCAERGQRTLVISTDIAHSLADSFDVSLGGEPTVIAENLWGQESDVYYNVRRYWEPSSATSRACSSGAASTTSSPRR